MVMIVMDVEDDALLKFNSHVADRVAGSYLPWWLSCPNSTDEDDDDDDSDHDCNYYNQQ